MKIVADSAIPYLEGVLEPYAEVCRLPGSAIRQEHVLDADALLVRTRTRCDGKLLGSSRVRFVGTATIGTDHIDLAYCRRAGIATADIDPAIEECSARLRADARKVIDHLEGGGSQQDDYVVRKIRRVNDGSREFNDLIRTQAARWLGEGKTVGLIGGDHSTPYGLIAALADCNPGFGVLHVDAHCDLRDAYEGFEFSHASIMHNVLRDFPQVSRLVQVGVRDYCDAEAERARTDPRIALFDDRTLREAVFDGRSWLSQCARIVDALPPLVYVSFDVDGLTIEHCPHTGTPVPGGLTFDEAACLLECVVRSGRRIIGFDLVEVVPSDDDRTDVIVGARMLYKLCGLTLKSNAR